MSRRHRRGWRNGWPEVTRGRDPLNGTDDAIGALEHVEIVSRLSQHEQHDPLPPLATTLRFDVGPGFESVAVARATSVQGPYQLFTTLSGAPLNGRYVDTGPVAGQTYLLHPAATHGDWCRRVPSDAVCAVARADMTAPTGMITLEDGALSTSKTVLSAQIDFDNESSVGASMRLIRPDGSDTGWPPLAPMATLDTTSLPRPGSALVQLQFA
ncbi:MAG: hypothetical protein IPK97_10490 [Ahniella sp.]|nr:hypothetical protein [Ahniella sp.]